MAINFPSSPTVGQTYVYEGRSWTWNGEGWAVTGSSVGAGKVLGRQSGAGAGAVQELPIAVDSSGNVGIGTSSPSSMLTIQGAGTSPFPKISVINSTAAVGSEVALQTGYMYSTSDLLDINSGFYSSGGPADKPILLTTGNSIERMRIGSNGNVSIGTSDTSDKLRLFDASFSQLKIIGDTGVLQLSSSSTSSSIGTDSDTPLLFNTNVTERMRIDSAGDVGVGTIPFSFDGFPSKLSIAFTPATYWGHTAAGFGNSADGAFSLFYKTRGASLATRSALLSGDRIGGLYFGGASSGSTDAYGAAILAGVSANWTSTSSPTDLVFRTTSAGSIADTEKMRITSDGNVGIGTSEPGARLDVASASYTANITNTASDASVMGIQAFNASYAQAILFTNSDRAGSADYSHFVAYSASFGDVEFRLRGDGEAFADGSWTGGGADYAEYFEWSDGNADEEDRRGYSVVLDGEKVRPATSDDAPSSIMGVVSTNPAVVGDAAWNHWTGKYLRDEFGSRVMEDYEVWEWTEVISKPGVGPGAPDTTEDKLHSYAFDAVPDGVIVPDDKTVIVQQRRKLNPDYDPDTEYVSRENRPEWATIGLMGKLRLRKGQPVRDTWIKMRDISQNVEEWLVR